MDRLKALLLDSIEVNVKIIKVIEELYATDSIAPIAVDQNNANLDVTERNDNLANANTIDPTIQRSDSCEDLWERRRSIHKSTDSPASAEIYQPQQPETSDEIKINPLFRLRRSERDQLLYKFFLTAKSNIEQLGIDPNSAEYDSAVQVESDRLINDWIEFKYRNHVKN